MNFSTPELPSIGTVIPGRNEATCLAYHESGKRLYVASAFDSRLQVIDCLDGKADQPALRCEREKIHILEPTYVSFCSFYALQCSFINLSLHCIVLSISYIDETVDITNN
jgi:hypothetical protein